MTKTFQEVTPFEVFEEFFTAFPILADHKSVDFGHVLMDSGYDWYASGELLRSCWDACHRLHIGAAEGVVEDSWNPRRRT